MELQKRKGNAMFTLTVIAAVLWVFYIGGMGNDPVQKRIHWLNAVFVLASVVVMFILYFRPT
jgi:hypothetical protein